jgi:hypothetical protein
MTTDERNGMHPVAAGQGTGGTVETVIILRTDDIIQAKDAEIEKYRQALRQSETSNSVLRPQRSAALEENEKLRKALEFYADENSYRRQVLGYNNKSGAVHGDNAADIDGGTKAREALNQKGE